MRIAFANGLVFVPERMEPRPGLVVTVADGVIEAVAEGLPSDPAIVTVDLAGRVLMPGSSIATPTSHSGRSILAHPDEPYSYLCGLTYQALEQALRRGCVGVRDPGGLDAGFRNAVHAGLRPPSPTSVTIVSPIDGIADPWRSGGIVVPTVPGLPDPGCTGPVEARAKVREVVRAGADVIKIAATGGVSSHRREPRQRLFTAEELEAIVDGHCLGVAGDVPRPWRAWPAHGPAGRRRHHRAWRLAGRRVDRGDGARGTWYIPTLSAYVTHAERGSSHARPGRRDVAGPQTECSPGHGRRHPDRLRL